MEPHKDWPAAHSMDTAWYAVDAEGNIGRFETGEAGAMPHGAAHEGGPDEPNFDVGLLVLAVRRATGASSDGYEPPPGVFLYGNDDYGVPGAYVRSHVPDKPVKFDDLDPTSQAAIGAVRLEATFASTEQLQLADHLEDDEAFSWDDTPLRGEDA